MKYLETLISLAQEVADEDKSFFKTKGPGKGDKHTAKFIAELRNRARESLGRDFSEKQICGENKFSVDYYFPEEKTIVEVALGLHNASREFEKDIIKAILAKCSGAKVSRLVFLSKPGGVSRNTEPGPRSIIHWVENDYKIKVIIVEIQDKHQGK